MKQITKGRKTVCTMANQLRCLPYMVTGKYRASERKEQEALAQTVRIS